MENQLLLVLMSIGKAIQNLIHSAYGVVMVCFTFIFSYFMPIEELVNIMLIIVIADLLFGVWVVIKTKGINHILSIRLRDTGIKLFFYLFFMMISFLIENQLSADSYISTKVIFAFISSVECVSIAASMLIIAPNMPFLKIISFFFQSEIAKKLGIEMKDVEEFFDNKKQKKDENKQ